MGCVKLDYFNLSGEINGLHGIILRDALLLKNKFHILWKFKICQHYTNFDVNYLVNENLFRDENL